MESNSHDGKAKPRPRLTPAPEASTFSSRAHGQDEAEGRANGVDSMVPENPSESENVHGDNGGAGPSYVQTIDRSRLGLSPGKIDMSGEEEEEDMDLDSLSGGVCIRCNFKDGKVLFCSEMGCPIAIHEKCMSCKPRFDELGNFYCPYCSYKRVLVKTWKLRENTVTAKKALSIFLDNSAVVGNKEQHADEGNKRKEPDVLAELVDRDCGNHMNSSIDDEFRSHFPGLEEDQPKGNDNSLVGCSGKDRMVFENEACPDIIEASINGIGVPRGEGSTADSELFQVLVSRNKRGKTSVSEMHPFKMVEDKEPEQAVNLGPKHDSQQNEGILEDKEGAEHLNVSQTEVDTTVNCAVNVSNGAVNDVTRVCGKNDGREENEEQMQPNNLNESAKATKSGEEDLVEAESLSACHLEEETIANVEFYRSSGVHAGTRLHKKKKCSTDAEEAMQVEHVDGHSNVTRPEYEEMEKTGHLHRNNLQEETRAGSAMEDSNGGANGNSREEDQQHIQPDNLERHANSNVILDNETLTVRRRRFKTKAQKKTHIQHVDSSRQVPSRLKEKLLSSQVDNVQENAENLIKKAPISKRSPESRKKISNLSFADAKRKRKLWTTEEEAALKQGVELFSSKANKNMPWRKILEFGHNVFHPNRTPAELKDKWRNIMAKEALNTVGNDGMGGRMLYSRDNRRWQLWLGQFSS